MPRHQQGQAAAGHMLAGPPHTVPLPGTTLLTLNGSQNHKLGPRQFCPPRCFLESCASNRYQKHLQGWKRRQDYPGVLALGMGVNFLCLGGGQPQLRPGTCGLGAAPTVYSCRLLSHTEVWPQGSPDRPALGHRWVRHLLLFLGNNHRLMLLRPSSHVSPPSHVGASHRVEPSSSGRQGQAGSFPSSVYPICTCPPIRPDQTRPSCLPTASPAKGSQGLCPRAGGDPKQQEGGGISP